MFARISAFLAVAIAVAASARMERHVHIHRNNVVKNCNTGNVKCCNSVANATDIAKVLDILAYSYDPADTVALDCNPINIGGAGEGASCQAQPVCCSNNTYSGSWSINVGCSPMDLN